MRRRLHLFLFALLPLLPLGAQKTTDFTEHLLKESVVKESVDCITLTQQMLGRIGKLALLSSGLDKNAAADMRELLDQCQSLRVLAGEKNVEECRSKALTLLRKNRNRYLLFDEENGVWFRIQGKRIVEVVLLPNVVKDGRFVLVGITGDFSEKTLRESFLRKKEKE